MFAIFLPHITEEIYSELYKDFIKIESIHLTQFPEQEQIDVEALDLGNSIMEIIAEIRKYKATKKFGPGAELKKLTVWHPNPKVNLFSEEIEKIARVKHLHIEEGALKASE